MKIALQLTETALILLRISIKLALIFITGLVLFVIVLTWKR
jgi:hypothetical protein